MNREIFCIQSSHQILNLLPLLVSTFFLFSPQPALASGVYDGLPIALTQIPNCESGDGTEGSARQFNLDGSVVTHINKNGTRDYGAFQINSTHIKEAKALGDDIFTLQGNIAFALYLYSKNGTQPWNASKACWGGASPPK